METINAVIAQYSAIAFFIICALVFVVSAITQVIKNIGALKKIPTDLVVIVLSLALTICALYAAGAYFGFVVVWYYVIGAVIGAFIVAFVAMFGWSKLTSLLARIKNMNSNSSGVSDDSST